MTNRIRTLIAQRKALKRELNRTGHRLVRNMCNNVKRLIERLCFRRYNQIFQQHIQKFKPNHNNNKKLWTMPKILKGKRAKLPFLQLNGRLLTSEDERAEALADNFLLNNETTTNQRSSVETERMVKRCANQMRADTSKNNDATTFAKPKEIREIIRFLPNNKAPGKDGVTNLMVKNSSRKAIVAFTYIINACIVLSYFPDK